MSANSSAYLGYEQEAPSYTPQELEYAPRKAHQVLYFVPSVTASGISWMSGGIPALTNFSWVLLTAVCAALLASELLNFSRRFGMGAITMLAGALVWFCYDYLTNWFFYDFNSAANVMSVTVIAKASFLHQLFVMFMLLGMNFPVWKRVEAFLEKMPEPNTNRLYMILIITAFIVGLIPYLFFAADPLPVALWKEIVGGRGGGAGFTSGRSGNININWGGYLAQFQQVGQIGGILAVFYLLLLPAGWVTRVVLLGMWLLQVGLAFGSGTRGKTAYILLPVLFLLFLKYHSRAAEMFRKMSVKAYVISGVLALGIIVMLQIQITYRNQGFENIQMDQVQTEIQGNSMFSEGLPGMVLIPDQYPFLEEKFPGQGAIMALPDMAWRFVYGPIPRAIWTSKPIDPLWAWYRSVISGNAIEETEGTTYATGLVGDWYFRFGIIGMIEGAIFMGWLYLLGERLMLKSQGRLIQLVLALGILVFLFRAYRNFIFIDLYPLLIGVGFLWIMIRFTGGRSTPSNSP